MSAHARPVDAEWAMDDLAVQDAMTRLVVTLRPGDSILCAATVLASNRISGAPVVEAGKVAGVVSEADLVDALSPPRGRFVAAPQPLLLLLARGTVPHEVHDLCVGDVMTRHVISIGPGDGIWKAAELIDRHGVRRLPVFDEKGYLIGVLARSDLIRCMALGRRGASIGPAPA